MTITAQTTTTLDDYVVNYFKWESVKAIRGNLGLAKRCQTWGSQEFLKEGNHTIQVPVAPTYTVQTRVSSSNQNDDYTFQTANSSNFQMTLDTEFYIALAETPYLSSFSNPEHVSACIKNQITALAEKFEETICGVVSQFTNTAIGSYDLPITAMSLGKANKTLTDAKMPNENRIAVLSTADYLSLSNNEALRQKLILDAGSVKPFNLELFESQYVVNATDPATGTRNFVMYAPEIIIATAVPRIPDNVKSITITDTDSGLTIQYYEAFEAYSGKTITCMRTFFAVKPLRTTAGVELKGSTVIAD